MHIIDVIEFPERAYCRIRVSFESLKLMNEFPYGALLLAVYNCILLNLKPSIYITLDNANRLLLILDPSLNLTPSL